MKTSAKSMLWSALVAVMAVLLASCVEEKRQAKTNGRAAQVIALLKNLESVDLRDEQATRIEDLAAQFSGKISAARIRLGDAADRITAARRQAAQDGKKGKELEEAGLAGASAAEKINHATFQKAVYDFRKAVAEVLTPQQREQAGLKLGSDGNWKLAVPQ